MASASPNARNSIPGSGSQHPERQDDEARHPAGGGGLAGMAEPGGRAKFLRHRQRIPITVCRPLLRRAAHHTINRHKRR